jgi:hypothetical protein
MPVPTVDYVPRPFAMPRYTPDLTRLASIFGRGGNQLVALDLQRGETTANTLARLSSILSSGMQGTREDKADKIAKAIREKERADDKKFQAEQARLAREERQAERKADLDRDTGKENRAAARWMVDNTQAGVVDNALAKFASQFPELAGRFNPQTTLPARVAPGAMGEISPVPEPTGQTVLSKSPDDARADASLAAQQARWAAEDTRAGVDDKRAERALEATIANQKLMGRIAQQKADAEGNDKTALTPGGIDVAALNYRKTGVMPPLGMGDKGTRQRIINRAAEMTPADMARVEATGADIAAAKQDFTANQASLNALQKSRDAIGAFEQTAQKNIDVFLDVAGKVVDSGSPLANKLLRHVSGNVLGSPDVAAYEAARQVAVNEIAKITSNPTLAGQLTDSARKEVASFAPENATLKQSVAVMRLLKTEMQNRTKALDAELAAVRARRKTDVPASKDATGGGGFIEALDTQGNVHHAPAGTPLPAGWKLKQ